MAGRRSDTRERIQEVALELFVEQGYEKTSLREIAERLEVTKAALYYHFRTKEDILHSLIEDIEVSLDELVAWAKEQNDPAKTRAEVLRRFSALVQGRFGPVMSFIQQNIPTMKGLGAKHDLGERMRELFALICSDEDDPEMQLRARLALVAVLFGANPVMLMGPQGRLDPDIALKVALELASPQGAYRGT
jgi:AcrR family transcriptional regulator